MARLEELIERISDEPLRQKIEREIGALKERTRFGLVYERHLPETSLISDADLVQVGALVRPKRDVDKAQTYRVVGLDSGIARLAHDPDQSETTVPASDLFVLKPFGEPVYPTLEPLEAVHRSGTRPYHAVINGENYHALQLLAYLHEGKVDCIYIDPPFNSGAADWKYNNRYVDGTDSYRHSKWLSMMEKRLRIAKRLLRSDGVLVVAIDENEVHHLGVLLEDIFPEYLRYLVTVVANPKGTAKVNFSRVEEYAIFLVPDTGYDVIAQLAPRRQKPEPPTTAVSKSDVTADELPDEDVPDDADDIAAEITANDDAAYSVLYLRRRGAESSYRESRPRQFYAILVDENTKTVVGIGPDVADADQHPRNVREGNLLAVYPVDSEGNERVWRYGRETMQGLIDDGEIRVGKYNTALDTYTLNHWKPVPPDKAGLRRVRTVWWETRHDAGTHGTTLVANLLGRRQAFPFPKSLYAVRDALETVVKHRPDALIVDFFAGSGTTLHATCLLNHEDGGRRRCILVTNNEVDRKTTRKLKRQGVYRGDPDFEAHGIFESATLPRVKTAITGRRSDGTAVPKGKKYQYIGGMQFAQGFEENVEFFKLGYADPDRIELGEGFESIHPLLWLASGAGGTRSSHVDPSRPYLICAEAGYAVLFRVTALSDLEMEIVGCDGIGHVYVVTDSPEAFAEAREVIGHGRETHMLYRDYLRNFGINTAHSA